MAANSDKLGKLHELVTDALIELVQGTDIPEMEEEGPEGEIISHPAQRIPPSAAVIQAASKFLIDNKITCIPSEDNKLGELERQMAEREVKRKARRTASAEDLSTATSEADFLGGLQ